MAAGEKTVSSDDEFSEAAWRVLIHDFRNLLAVIVNYSELISEETEDAAAVKADIQEVRQAAERAIALTDKLRRPTLATTVRGDVPSNAPVEPSPRGTPPGAGAP
jgi:light-regulated signal transduction histidine kinase (bacteriophytochrome)